MADPPPYPNSREEAGTPRWVKVLGIIVAVVVLLVVALMFIGGGGHTPRRHGGAGGDTPPSTATADAPWASQAVAATADRPRVVMDDDASASQGDTDTPGNPRNGGPPSWDT